MPTVGKRHFTYTAKGEKAASMYAKKTGMPLTVKKGAKMVKGKKK